MPPTLVSIVTSPSRSSEILLHGMRAVRYAMPLALSSRARKVPNSKGGFWRPRAICRLSARTAMGFSIISMGRCSGLISRAVDGWMKAWPLSPCRQTWGST